MSLKHIFSALSSPNYRLFTVGHFISNTGYLIETIALHWLVYRLTDSAMFVGILLFINQGTIFLTSPFSGILADRFARYKLLIITNIIAAITSLVLGLAIVMGFESLWFIFLTQVIGGLVRGIDNPVRNTFVNDLIEKPEHLVNAISLNSSIFNVAKIIGPAIAAILIPWAGEGVCFLLNGVSFVSIIVVLRIMNHKPQDLSPKQTNVWGEIKEGFEYAFGYSPVRCIILFVSFIGLFNFSLNVTLPVYAKQVLEGGADTFGFITTYSGIGALMAALYMAAKRNAVGLDITILAAAVIYSLAYFTLSFFSGFAAAALIMVVGGFGHVLVFASASSILQTLSNKEKMGRVIGIYFMVFMACTTVGSLLTGKLTDTIGAANTIRIVSSVTLVVAVVYSLQIRQIRRKSLRRFLTLGIGSEDLRDQYVRNI
ncbi:MAG: MFS transporter [Bacteroidetes bacterium]|nr:MFS transporter [Bacteroidota bacterium]